MARQQLSRAAPATWSRTSTRCRSRRTPTGRDRYSRQPEIWRYLQRCAEDFGAPAAHPLPPRGAVRGVGRGASRWRIDTSRGTVTRLRARAGLGPAQRARRSREIPGLDRFEGRTFHSARWDHGFDLTGRRVAVIGTGASAAQFIPEIQPKVAQLTVFQRTPAWVLPRARRAHPALAAPPLPPRPRCCSASLRLRIYLQREAVPAAVPPSVDDAPGAASWPVSTCERAVPRPRAARPADARLHDGVQAHPALERLLPGAHAAERRGRHRRHRRGARALDRGRRRRRAAVDAIILGTGFRPTDPPLAAAHPRARRPHARRGLGGQPARRTRAPPSPASRTSSCCSGRTPASATPPCRLHDGGADRAPAGGARASCARTGRSAVEPRPEAQEAYVAAVDRRSTGTVWVAGGCKSWYLDRRGATRRSGPTSRGGIAAASRASSPEEYVLSFPRKQSAGRGVISPRRRRGEAN